MFTEATFNNSLKNDASNKNNKSKKKDSKKSEKSDDDDEEDYLSLSDEEKDARDYQLQRAMDMVRALSKVGKKNLEKTEDEKSDEKEDKKESGTNSKK